MMEKYNREIMNCYANASLLIIKTTETKGEGARVLGWETKKANLERIHVFFSFDYHLAIYPVLLALPSISISLHFYSLSPGPTMPLPILT